MKLQTNVMNYGGNGVVIGTPPTAGAAREACLCLPAQARPDGGDYVSNGKAGSNGMVDFTKMTPAEKVAYHKARWDRILG